MKLLQSLAILIALGAQFTRAQTPADSLFDAITRQGIDHVYNLEFEKADSEFTVLEHMRPAHPAGRFFLAMTDWWRILIDIENTRYDTRFFAELDGVVDLCDSLLDIDKNNVTAIFFKGGAIGFEGRLRFHRDDYLAAANAGRKALGIIRDAESLDPGNADILLGAGMYNYYADVLPKEYPYLKPLMLFIPAGDKQKGIEQLNEAAARGKYASVESMYFLMQLYYYYEKDYPKALAIALQLTRRYPNNMLFHKYLGRCYASESNWSEGLAVFSDIEERSVRGQRGYTTWAEREAEYYIGLCQMNLGRIDKALPHFFRCDEVSRTLDRDGESGFMVLANLRIGMIDDLLGKREEAKQQYRKVLGMKEYLDSYAEAQQFLNSPYAQ